MRRGGTDRASVSRQAGIRESGLEGVNSEWPWVDGFGLTDADDVLTCAYVDDDVDVVLTDPRHGAQTAD